VPRYMYSRYGRFTFNIVTNVILHQFSSKSEPINIFWDTNIYSKPKSSFQVNMFSIGMWYSKLVWLFDFSSLGVKKVFFLFQLFSKEFSKFVHGLFEICNRDIPTTAWPHFWSTERCTSQQNVMFEKKVNL
jgi:hypothetical protein